MHCIWQLKGLVNCKLGQLSDLHVFSERVVTKLSQLCAGSCADFHINISVHFISLILSKSCDLPAPEISLLTQLGILKELFPFFCGTFFRIP